MVAADIYCAATADTVVGGFAAEQHMPPAMLDVDIAVAVVMYSTNVVGFLAMCIVCLW